MSHNKQTGSLSAHQAFSVQPHLDNEGTGAMALQQQLSVYRQAEKMMTEIEHQFARGEDPNLLLDRLQARLDQLGAVPPAAEVGASMPAAGAREVAAELQQVLESLIHRVNRLERMACETRDQIVPQISHETRSRQMRSAYTRHIA